MNIVQWCDGIGGYTHRILDKSNGATYELENISGDVVYNMIGIL